MGLSQRADTGPCRPQETSRDSRSVDRDAMVHSYRGNGGRVVCLCLLVAVPLLPRFHGGLAGRLRLLRTLSSRASSLPFQESTVSTIAGASFHSSSISGHKLRSHQPALGSCFRYYVPEGTQKDGARQRREFDGRRIQTTLTL